MLIWISVVTIFCGITKDQALNYADGFFDSEYYEQAITEYKRFIYFNPNDKNINYAYLKIGLAYRNEEKWEESIQALRQTINTATTDSIKNEREVALAVTFIASGNYSVAEILLLRIEMSTIIPKIKQKASFLRGIIYLYKFKWDSARDVFQSYFDKSQDSTLHAQIDSLLLETKNFKYVSPDTARVYSTIIPGAGQIYAGNWKNGLNAFVLNGALASAIIYKIVKADYMNALVIWYFLMKRYYIGNRYHAQRIANEHNQLLNQTAAQEIINKLLEE